MKKHLIASLLTILLAAVTADRANATVAEVFGVGGKAVAMGGAFTAVADDSSATWYNPAGLTQPSSIQVGGGLLFLNYNLRINGKPRPQDSRGGAYIGLVAPLFHGRGAAGVWGYYPQNILQLNQFANPAEPHFGFDEIRHQIFDLSPALAFDINPKLSIGVGVRLISNQHSKLNLFLPIAFNGAEQGGTGDIVQAGSGQLVVEAENRISPVFGVLWRPYENLKLGFSYRYFNRQDIRIDNNASTITTSSNNTAFVSTLLAQDAIVMGRFQGFNFYSPQAVTLGVAYDPNEHLTLAANLDWEQWSQTADDRLNGRRFQDFKFKLGTDEPLLINFREFQFKARDILIPRVGFEWRPKTKKGPLGAVDFQVRGGWAYRPSPFENNQVGALELVSQIVTSPTGDQFVRRIRSSGSNDVDANRQILSVGLGMTIDDPVGWAEKWQFDVWWQSQILQAKTFRNQAFTGLPPDNGEFTEFGPKLRVTGYLNSCGVFFTAKF